MKTMTDKTKQKIMDAALKIFAKEGFKATTTRSIAKESGFTELTLFRKFKTKKNLYEAVINSNIEKMVEDYRKTVLVDKEFEDDHDFLDTFLKNSMKNCMDNFDIFSLYVNSENKKHEAMFNESFNDSVKYVEKHLPDKKIDYRIFLQSINAFVYMTNLEIFHGRTSSLGQSHEEIVDNMVDLLNCMVK